MDLLLIMILDFEFFVCLRSWGDNGFKVVGLYYDDDEDRVYSKLE